MTDRVEFRVNRVRLWIAGVGLVAAGAAVAALPWVNRNLDPSDAPALVTFGVVGLIGPGFFILWGLHRTGVQVAVDRDGITDFRRNEGPIAWAEVERIEPAFGYQGTQGLKLVLRPGPHVAGRMPGAREVVLWDAGLTGGTNGVRRAIDRFASQVPRFWQREG